jgi:hypothetical protein
MFEDLDTGVWYESAVSWMMLHDVASGCTTSLFCPDASLTRQQFVTFLWRAAGRSAALYLRSGAFADGRQIGWAVANGVTRGVSPENVGIRTLQFCVERSVTGEEMTTSLYRHTEADYSGQR